MDASAEPKWHRKPNARPEQILEAALEVFAEKGFRAATMDQIARRAGITKGTIYLYFPSKEEVFIAMLRNELRQALDLLPELAIEPGEDLEQVARRLGRQSLDIMMSPRVVKAIPLVVAEFHHIPELQRIYHEEILPQANLRLGEVLEAGMFLGILRKLDPVIAARSLLGMFAIFVITQEIFGAKAVTPMETEAISKTIFDIYFHGVLQKDEKRAAE